MIRFLVSMYLSSTWQCIKNKLYKVSRCWSRYMLNFDFFENGLRLVFPPCFVHDILKKMFLVLCCINWPNFIVWLPFLFEILCNMCIVIISFPVYHTMNFEDNLSFLIKLSFYMTCYMSFYKNLITFRRKTFEGEIKSSFHHF